MLEYLRLRVESFLGFYPVGGWLMVEADATGSRWLRIRGGADRVKGREPTSSHSDDLVVIVPPSV
jgi:hypothetical protein